MRKRELELIAGLAEGTLEDETEARALIESSQQHRFEYETQRAAIEALRSVEPARLSDHERAALHRDVWTELQTAPPAAARSPWYYRWAYVAAGFLVVAVGLGTVLSQGADDAGDTFAEVSAGLADDLAANETATTESAAGAATAEDGQEDSASAPLAPLSSMFTELFDESARLARSGDLRAFEAAGGTGVDESMTHAECLARTELGDYEVLGEISVEEAREFGLEAETPYIIAVPAGVALGPDTPVAFVESGTCVVVHIDG